jgi:peptidoglycan hydrolase CwlO-like protein
MANMNDALQQLREQREQVQLQVDKLNSAISVLEDLFGRNSSTAARNGGRPKRVVSAIARRRMAQAQRARWAKVRGGAKSSGTAPSKAPVRRILSAAARRKIAAAQRARWARVRAQQKSAA